jgi:site-specific DNA recombinase
VLKDASTSPERQIESIKKFADYREHDLIEIGPEDYDLDVSGAVSPFDRPGLGRWLKQDKLDEWDAICAAKLDRISRSLFDFTAFVHWLEAHGKSLIILDPELDLTTKEGRVMANILMTFAEYEREVIGARVKDAYDKLVQSGHYTGGFAPFGYRPVKTGKNWAFEIDPGYAPVVQQMADRFLAYESLGSIARWLTESGVPSPRDVHRIRKGKPPQNKTPWRANTVRSILSSMSVLGAVTNIRGIPLRDDQGLVIYRADPLIDRDAFERIQVRLAQNPVPVRVNSTPLLRIAFCTCGGYMHRTSTWVTRQSGATYAYSYYQCRTAKEVDGRCSAKRVRAEPLEEAVFGTLLELAGHRRLRAERVIPGRDHSEESARLIEQTQHLQADIGRARLQRRDYSELQATLDRANAELDRLAALDPEPARLEYDELDQTFQDWWDAHDSPARNEFLRQQGVKIVVSPDPLPEDLVLARPDMIFSVSVIERDGFHAILYMGNLGDLLNRAGNVPITVRT